MTYIEYFERVVLFESLGDEHRSLPVDAIVTDVNLAQVLVTSEHLADGDATLVVKPVPRQIHRRQTVVPLRSQIW